MSFRRQPSKADRILDAMIEKQAELNANATTSWLAGFTSCGDNTARIIIASENPITVQETVSIVGSATNQKMRAYVPSFATLPSPNPNLHIASIHAYKPKFSLMDASQENVSKLHAISATSYMDTELNTVWQRRVIDGAEYLIRANEDNPQEVLTTALLASTSVEARMEGSAFNLHAEPGNFVLFFATSNPEGETKDFVPFLEVAEVTASTHDSITVSLKENGFSTQAIIPTSSVVQTIVATAEDTALGKVLTREEVIDFLKKCYPQSYGTALDSISTSERL